MSRFAIVGSGDLAHSIVRLAAGMSFECVALYDDFSRDEKKYGIPLRGGVESVFADWRNGDFESVVVGIGYKHFNFRESVRVKLQNAGIPLQSIVHESVIIAKDASVCEGCIVFPGVAIDVGVYVGPNVVLNAGVTLAHDTRIAADSILGPGVVTAGFVSVGSKCFLGASTTVIDSVVIPERVQTGAGAVVVKTPESRSLIVGIPARFLRSLE